MPAGHPVPKTRAVNVRELEKASDNESEEAEECDGKPRKLTMAELEARFPSSEVHVPAEELSCAGAMPGTTWFLRCRKGFHPTGVENKSLFAVQNGIGMPMRRKKKDGSMTKNRTSGLALKQHTVGLAFAVTDVCPQLP